MMSNPMRDPLLNRLPLSTIADYMNAPALYDEEKALQRALRRFSRHRKDRAAFARLAEMYTSNMAAGQSRTSYNAVREMFSQALSGDRAAAASIAGRLQSIYDELAPKYRGTCSLGFDVIRKDLDWMQAQLGE